MTAPAATPFSTLVRDASAEQHEEAENSSFVRDLLGGKLSVEAYVRYTEQLWFVYEALEESTERLATHPVTGPFIRPELARLPELARDLDHLHGSPQWRTSVTPLTATERYAARVRQVAADWPAGYVVHHYTRYLGDLSGGQVIRSVAEKTWDFTPKGDGVRFYVFEAIGNPAAFKRDYRAHLDALPVGGAEQQRAAEECKQAFRLNAAVFAELATATA